MPKYNVNIKKLDETAVIPVRGSDYAAGYDLYANLEYSVVIKPHETVKIGTGVAMNIPENHFGAIFARSGLATKKGLRPANCVGVVDEDYTGELIVAVHNDSDETKVINPKERIAQLAFIPYSTANFIEVEELTVTERGDNGFGSTGE